MAFLTVEAWRRSPVTWVLMGTLLASCATDAIITLAFGWKLDVFRTRDEVAMILGAAFPGGTLVEHRWDGLLTHVLSHRSVLIGFGDALLLRWALAPTEASVGSVRALWVFTIGSVVGGCSMWLERADVFISGPYAGLAACAAALMVWERRGKVVPLRNRRVYWVVPLLAVAAYLWFNSIYLVAGGALAGAALGLTSPLGAWYSRRIGVAAGAALLALTLAALGRYSFRVATDPYAWMTANTRYNLAVDHGTAGRCDEARTMFDATARVFPRTPELEASVTELMTQCDARRMKTPEGPEGERPN